MKTNFVYLAPTYSGSDELVCVSKANKSDIGWWCNKVQPFIAKIKPYRADVNWNWGFLFRTYSRFNRYEFFKLTTINSKGIEVIIGLLLLDVKAKYIIDKRSNSVFLWYLSNLPSALGEILKTPNFMKVGEILIDIALCVSFRYNNKGRMWLHAAKPNKLAVQKGFDLVGYYSKVGMTRFDLPKRRVSLMRANDGRYFFHTPTSAKVAINVLNKFRK